MCKVVTHKVTVFVIVVQLSVQLLPAVTFAVTAPAAHDHEPQVGTDDLDHAHSGLLVFLKLGTEQSN